MITVSDVPVLIDNNIQMITIESIDSKQQLEANAYLLNRLLYTVEKMSADNIRLKVSEQAFEDIKKHLGR